MKKCEIERGICLVDLKGFWRKGAGRGRVVDFTNIKHLFIHLVQRKLKRAENIRNADKLLGRQRQTTET